MKKKVGIVFYFCCLFSLFSQQYYPRIQKLQVSDLLFVQLEQDIAASYKALAAGEVPVLKVYSYIATETDDLLSIASRCSIPYETIATLNRLSSADAKLSGRKLLLPSCPGLFLPEISITPLEHIMEARTIDTDFFLCYNFDQVSFGFFPDRRFSATERAFFTDTSLKPPIIEGLISSPFGKRVSPISGQEHFHNGVDIAAALGSSIFACKTGIVIDCGFDAVYGNYVLLQHENGMQSLYAHLSQILVKVSESVNSLTVLGKVGSTGLSTGPHLHFEIRVGSESIDPGSVFK